MGRLAILAGSGKLPEALAKSAKEAHLCSFEGVSHQLGEGTRIHRFDQLGKLFKDLSNEGVTEIVMAGAIQRPNFELTKLDLTTLSLLPRLKKSFSRGDDALLRDIIRIFEERGFHVVGAHQVHSDLTLDAGHIAGPKPSDEDLADAQRAISILSALSPVDVGQAAIVGGGLCLGIETIQGTDALIRFASETSPSLRRGKGVLVKATKTGQDLRVDAPTIGPETIRNAAKAGLSGIIIEAGLVLVLEREETLAAANEHGIFLRAEVL